MSENNVLYIILIIFIFAIFIGSFILLYYLFLEHITKFLEFIKKKIKKFRENNRINKIIDNNNLKQIKNLNEICIICMEEGNKKFIKLNCEHFFHKKCLKKWIINNNSCPLCRTEVLKD
tara:strand:- start:41 stop:397 length:357 start_codon:yes stop_codon:yes gene_type:complete